MTTPTPPSSQDLQFTIIYTPPVVNDQIVKIPSPSVSNSQMVKRNLNIEFNTVENTPNTTDTNVSNMLQNIMCKQAGSMFMGAKFSGCTFNTNLPKPN